MRSTGSRTLSAKPVAAAPSARKRVLFLCLGNVCRSQMAEGFARAYGSDVLDAVSAGLAPGMMVDPVTIRVMGEKGIDLTPHFPKDLAMAAARGVDIIVNLSGYPAPGVPGAAVRTWPVRDPHMHPDKVHREVRDHVENLVMQLVLELRAAATRSS